MNESAPKNHYIGVDVGTGSVRAALVQEDGTVVTSSTYDIVTFRDPNDHRIFEQSSTNIWSGICTVVRTVLAKSQIAPATVKGLGFDATCSLVVCDLAGEPVVVTRGDQLGQIGDRDVILWADHRAEKEAELVNNTGSVVLDYVGGTMSVRPLPSIHPYDRRTPVSSRWKYPRFSGSNTTCALTYSPAASSSTSPIS
jgi:ribulose kinase